MLHHHTFGGRPKLRLYLLLVASNKVVAGSTGVGDERVKVALRIEDDTVGTGGATRVDLVGREDGVFVPRGRGREVEALTVVVLVGVAVYGGVLAILLRSDRVFSGYVRSVWPFWRSEKPFWTAASMSDCQ